MRGGVCGGRGKVDTVDLIDLVDGSLLDLPLYDNLVTNSTFKMSGCVNYYLTTFREMRTLADSGYPVMEASPLQRSRVPGRSHGGAYILIIVKYFTLLD